MSMFHYVVHTVGVGMSETRLIVRLMDSKLMRSVRVVSLFILLLALEVGPSGWKISRGNHLACFIVCYDGCGGVNFFQANTHKLPIAFHFMPGANAGT
jgi:hypothetical protein